MGEIQVRKLGLLTGAHASSWTFSDVDLGYPAPDRYIIMAVAANAHAGETMDISGSATINGISATKSRGIARANTSCHLFATHVPNGQTGDIVLNATYSGTTDGCIVQLFSVRGMVSTTKTHSEIGFESSNQVSMTTDCNAKSIIFSVVSFANYSNSGGAVNWTNLTEAEDYRKGDYFVMSVAYDIFDTAQTDRTITAASTVTVGEDGCALTASFDGVETP